jgi:hypothetical protein
MLLTSNDWYDLAIDYRASGLVLWPDPGNPWG